MNEETMTYSELDLLSNKIANSSIQNGVTKNDIIGVSLNRGFDLIASLLGILKAGCAYLPLDKEYPQERLNYMLEHSQAKLLIYDNDDLNFSNSFKVNYLKSYESQDLGNVGDLAYVIYTSGSTGNPKGVCLDHAALINLLHHQKSENSNVVTLQFTPISFDVHFQEIFSTLTTGGKLVLIDELTRLDFNNLLSVIFKANIERIFLPFVALSKLAQVATNKNLYPTNLKYVTTAGEQLRITNSIRLFFKNTKSLLFNHYGPSETHVVTSKMLSGDPVDWPELPSIGKILDGNQAILEQTESGETELVVGGKTIGLGYLYD